MFKDGPSLGPTRPSGLDIPTPFWPHASEFRPSSLDFPTLFRPPVCTSVGICSAVVHCRAIAPVARIGQSASTLTVSVSPVSVRIRSGSSKSRQSHSNLSLYALSSFPMLAASGAPGEYIACSGSLSCELANCVPCVNSVMPVDVQIFTGSSS